MSLVYRFLITWQYAKTQSDIDLKSNYETCQLEDGWGDIFPVIFCVHLTFFSAYT